MEQQVQLQAMPNRDLLGYEQISDEPIGGGDAAAKALNGLESFGTRNVFCSDAPPSASTIAISTSLEESALPRLSPPVEAESTMVSDTEDSRKTQPGGDEHFWIGKSLETLGTVTIAAMSKAGYGGIVGEGSEAEPIQSTPESTIGDMPEPESGKMEGTEVKPQYDDVSKEFPNTEVVDTPSTAVGNVASDIAPPPTMSEGQMGEEISKGDQSKTPPGGDSHSWIGKSLETLGAVTIAAMSKVGYGGIGEEHLEEEPVQLTGKSGTRDMLEHESENIDSSEVKPPSDHVSEGLEVSDAHNAAAGNVASDIVSPTTMSNAEMGGKIGKADQSREQTRENFVEGAKKPSETSNNEDDQAVGDALSTPCAAAPSSMTPEKMEDDDGSLGEQAKPTTRHPVLADSGSLGQKLKTAVSNKALQVKEAVAASSILTPGDEELELSQKISELLSPSQMKDMVGGMFRGSADDAPATKGMLGRVTGGVGSLFKGRTSEKKM